MSMKKSDLLPSGGIPIIIFLLASCSALFSDLYVPSLPAIAAYFKCSISLSQATVTCFVLGFAIGQFIYGALSDRYGRRKVLLVSLLITNVASIICIYSPTIFILLIGRFLQGVGVAACLSLPRAIMRDVYCGEQMAKIMSFISAAVELMITCAPAIGGYLTYYSGWRGNFYFLFAFVLGLLLFIYCGLPETNKKLDIDAIRMHKIKNNYMGLLRDGKFVSYAVCSGIAYALLMIYFLISPFILQNELHFSASQYGLVSLLTSAMLVVGALSNGYFISKFNLNAIIFVGIMLIVLAGLFMLMSALFFSNNAYLIIIFSMCAIIGVALLFSNCSAEAMREFSHMAGTASAVYSGLQISCAFIVIFFVSSAGFVTEYALAGIYLVLGVIAYLCYYFHIATNSRLINNNRGLIA